MKLCLLALSNVPEPLHIHSQRTFTKQLASADKLEKHEEHPTTDFCLLQKEKTQNGEASLFH